MTDEQRVLILNPISGQERHAETVRERAASHGFDVRETERAGHAIDLATEAAEQGATLLGVAGGDGTVNEAIRGLDRADALDRVTVGVVPAGTGNSFAEQLGIDGIDGGFDALSDGETRTIDLGMAGDRPFCNSCVAGLTADASAETTSELKERLGVLAYVTTTLRTAMNYDGMHLRIDGAGVDADWSGEALVVLIGNARRFTAAGEQQADVEDGLFEVTVVERRPALDLAGDVAAERLFGEDTDNVARFRTGQLRIEALDIDSITASLDGEMLRSNPLNVRIRPGVLRVRVGPEYEQSPTR